MDEIEVQTWTPEELAAELMSRTEDDAKALGMRVEDTIDWQAATTLTRLLSRITELERERDASDAALLSSICKEPPCMYGSNERVYIMSLIEARRRSAT